MAEYVVIRSTLSPSSARLTVHVDADMLSGNDLANPAPGVTEIVEPTSKMVGVLAKGALCNMMDPPVSFAKLKPFDLADLELCRLMTRPFPLSFMNSAATPVPWPVAMDVKDRPVVIWLDVYFRVSVYSFARLLAPAAILLAMYAAYKASAMMPCMLKSCPSTLDSMVAKRDPETAIFDSDVRS